MGMEVFKAEEYADFLNVSYDKKLPAYVYGGFGIGKSEIPRQVFRKVAEKKGRTFIEWADTTKQQKLDMIADPSKWFIFADIRLAGKDPTALDGIPNMNNADLLEQIPWAWIMYFSQDDADGVIFFDEMNLAPPVVQGQAYQIIHDRAVADRRLAKDVFVFGAGNRLIDKAFVNVMAMPLRDRFNEIEYEADIPSWTKWANGKVSPHLVAFVNWKENCFQIDPRTWKNSDEKAYSPRSIVRASKMIEGLDFTKQKATIKKFISSACGGVFAREFMGYHDHFRELKWEEIYDNPETVSKYKDSVDKTWAIIGGLNDHYETHVLNADKDEAVIKQGRFKNMTPAKMYHKQIQIALQFTPEYAHACLNFLKAKNEDRFTHLMLETLPEAEQDNLVEQLGKFLFQ